MNAFLNHGYGLPWTQLYLKGTTVPAYPTDRLWRTRSCSAICRLRTLFCAPLSKRKKLPFEFVYTQLSSAAGSPTDLAPHRTRARDHVWRLLKEISAHLH